MEAKRRLFVGLRLIDGYVGAKLLRSDSGVFVPEGFDGVALPVA